jgi:hypothetical protein
VGPREQFRLGQLDAAVLLVQVGKLVRRQDAHLGPRQVARDGTVPVGPRRRRHPALGRSALLWLQERARQDAHLGRSGRGRVQRELGRIERDEAVSGHDARRLLPAHEFAHLHEQHCRVKLPETELFPWAHGGADIPHSAAFTSRSAGVFVARAPPRESPKVGD